MKERWGRERGESLGVWPEGGRREEGGLVVVPIESICFNRYTLIILNN